jgi:hypothetical protein
MNLIGISPTTPDHSFNLKGEVVIQKVLAAFLMALATGIFYQSARLLLDPIWSGLIALGAAFGTQVWSTASRGMWGHTWGIVLGAIVVYLLIDAEQRHVSKSPTLVPATLATLLSWMFFVRPTGAIAVVCVSAYLIVRRPRDLPIYAAAGAIWGAAFVAYSIHFFGTTVPFYYAPERNDPGLLGIGLYCNLLSPSRGLLVYSPIVAFITYLVIRYWRSLPFRELALMALAATAMLTVAAATHRVWWEGQGYGCRFLADAVPWFVLIAILGCAAIPPGRRSLRSNPELAVGAILLALSVAINGRGALSWATMQWNEIEPVQVRVLDWTQPQFLAGWIQPH